MVTALGIKISALNIKTSMKDQMLHRLFFFAVLLPFLLSHQLDITLFILVPLEFPGENGNENDDEQERQEQYTGIEIRGIAHHPGSFIPSGEEIEPDGYDK